MKNKNVNTNCACEFFTRILKRDFYVDDLLAGAQTLEEALLLRNELIRLLDKGGFSLRNGVRTTKD